MRNQAALQPGGLFYFQKVQGSKVHRSEVHSFRDWFNLYMFLWLNWLVEAEPIIANKPTE